MSEGGMIKAARLATDFELAWVRFSSETGTPEELLLLGLGVGGHSFSLDGQEIFHNASRTGYLYARRMGERLRVETEEETYEVRLTMGDVEMMI
jgi:hypothetical protein